MGWAYSAVGALLFTLVFRWLSQRMPDTIGGPYAYVKNYRLGMRLRRQAVKDYLFWEIEPSYNWRIDEPYFDREGAWKIELRLEFLLFANPGETVERQIR